MRENTFFRSSGFNVHTCTVSAAASISTRLASRCDCAASVSARSASRSAPPPPLPWPNAPAASPEDGRGDLLPFPPITHKLLQWHGGEAEGPGGGGGGCGVGCVWAATLPCP